MKKSQALGMLVILALWSGLADAQYVVTLKNGRQLTVQSYRDEGSTVKVTGLGGEFGIAKDQIQSIGKSGAADRPGLNISNLENASRPAPAPAKAAPSAPSPGPSDFSSGVDSKPAVSGAEVLEYRRRLSEVTRKLEAARKRYLDASGAGNTGGNFSREGISAWTADLTSRIQDSQQASGGSTRYTAKGKELSDMRAEIDALEKERNDLLKEMQSKNIEA